LLEAAQALMILMFLKGRSRRARDELRRTAEIFSGIRLANHVVVVVPVYKKENHKQTAFVVKEEEKSRLGSNGADHSYSQLVER
jgi:hypothetical protein